MQLSPEVLAIQLDRLGVDPTEYAIREEVDSRLCAVPDEDGRWSVFFSERGQRVDEATFPNEDIALIYLLGLLTKTRLMTAT